MSLTSRERRRLDEPADELADELAGEQAAEHPRVSRARAGHAPPRRRRLARMTALSTAVTLAVLAFERFQQ